MVCIYIYHSFDFIWGWCIIELTTWVFAHFRRSQHLVCHHLSYINYQHGNFGVSILKQRRSEKHINFFHLAKPKNPSVIYRKSRSHWRSGSVWENPWPWNFRISAIRDDGDRWPRCGGFFEGQRFWRCFWMGNRLSMHPKLPDWNFERMIENPQENNQKCQRGN